VFVCSEQTGLPQHKPSVHNYHIEHDRLLLQVGRAIVDAGHRLLTGGLAGEQIKLASAAAEAAAAIAETAAAAAAAAAARAADGFRA
jgi:hypothetical protein